MDTFSSQAGHTPCPGSKEEAQGADGRGDGKGDMGRSEEQYLGMGLWALSALLLMEWPLSCQPGFFISHFCFHCLKKYRHLMGRL